MTSMSSSYVPPPSAFDPTEKVRVVVVGDPGVGKSCLVHWICQAEPLTDHVWTIGCSTDVKIHTHTRTKKSYFIEFIDVAGSCKHRSSREIFYQNINGIILVHDNTNRKSYENLWRWLNEVLMAHKGWTSSTSKSFPYKELESLSSSQQTQSPLPLLVIGTKTDVGGARLRKCTIVEEYGGDFLDMSTQQAQQYDSESLRQLDQFFDRIVDKRFTSSSISSSSSSSLYPSLERNIPPSSSSSSTEAHRRRMPQQHQHQQQRAPSSDYPGISINN